MLRSEAGFGAAAWLGPDGSWHHLFGRLRPDDSLLEWAREQRVSVVSEPVRRGHAGAALSFESGGGGVLLLAPYSDVPATEVAAMLNAIWGQLEMVGQLADRVAEIENRGQRAEMVMAISRDLGVHLDPENVLAELVERSAALFGAQHAAIFTRLSNGSIRAKTTRNLSAEYIECVEHAAQLPVIKAAFEQHASRRS